MSAEIEKELEKRLLQRASELNINLPKDLFKSLFAYRELLVKWSQKMNLSTHDETEFWACDIRDALEFSGVLNDPLLYDSLGEGVTDIGSGSGIPGLVAALFLPQLKFVLVEARAKRASFLKTALFQLGIKNAQVLIQRITKQTPLSTSLFTGRATLPWSEMIELCPHVLGQNKFLLLMLGLEGIAHSKEIKKAAQTSGLILSISRSYDCYPLDRSRLLMLFQRQ